MTIASEGHGIAAAVSQVPFSDGLASALRIPPLTSLKITWNAIVDLIRSAFGASPRYIDLLGSPGDVALMTAPDCAEGYGRIVSPEVEAAGRWHNRVTARTGLAVPMYAPARRTGRIQMPILVIVADDDTIAPADATVKAASRAPKAEVIRYPAGHFDYYVGEGFERIVGDEIAFLRRHLA
jgi:pimeloyl-ACP methyl ester carboxylesterase